MSFTTRAARVCDLPGVLAVQHRAFGRVARGLGIPPDRLPPLTESLGDLERLYDTGIRFFVAVDTTGAVVGSVRGQLRGATVEIGRLVVDDGWQRRGVATQLMDLLESDYAEATRFELFTGAQAAEPLALYRKRGYRIDRTDTVEGVALVWLSKPVLGGRE
jgi:GNAT superfamily N-acetyltransferase